MRSWVAAIRGEIANQLEQQPDGVAAVDDAAPIEDADGRDSEKPRSSVLRGSAIDAADLDELRTLNPTCADCGAPAPAWASINLGLCVCIECSGVHRSLGVHVSIVRSLKLDRMDRTVHRVMASVGNERANAIWEANVPQSWTGLKPGPTAEMAERARWIRAKYDQRVRLAIAPPRCVYMYALVCMHVAPTLLPL